MSGREMNEALAIEILHDVAAKIRLGCTDTCYIRGEMLNLIDDIVACAWGAWYLGEAYLGENRVIGNLFVEECQTAFGELYDDVDVDDKDEDYEEHAVEQGYQLLGSIFQINFSQLRRLRLPSYSSGDIDSPIWDWITNINDDFMLTAKIAGIINTSKTDPRLLIAQALDTIADQKLFTIM